MVSGPHVVSEYDPLRRRLAGEAMKAIPAVVELTCSRLGAPMVRRDRGAGPMEYPEPATGLLITRALQHVAAQWARNYMRDLREEGGSWQQIGEVTGWTDDPAGRAFAEATAEPWLDSETGQWRDDGTFGWRCPECGLPITDYGPETSDQRGHSAGCPRSS
jgi:hypothetical protein